MRLLVVSESPLEKCQGEYFGVDPWIRFVCHLADCEDKVTLLAPVTGVSKPAPESWCIDRGRLKIAHHEYYQSYAGFARLWFLHRGVWRHRFENLMASHDVAALRLPSPSLRLVMRAARKHRVPVVLLVAGDVRAQSDRLLQSRGILRLVYRALMAALVRQEVSYGRRAAAVFAYSSELAARHARSRVRLMRTPHLTAGDLVIRQDTCQTSEIRLLRVAWLVPSKGLESLLEATALLIRRGLAVRLSIVGKPRVPAYQSSLEELARQLGLEGRVEFRGWVPFDQLPSVYLEHDVQVISSIAEGTPRCIVEGLARGLPLVSTRVGGCADSLEDGKTALLVPPSNRDAMADAIERIVRDVPLRRALIANGYQLARGVTFDALGGTFLEELRTILNGAALALPEPNRAS